ncbi:MAG: hypothetical protein LDL31_10940 [Prosthecobacter sp.]|jgi:hypothetical protein|nr:hypothetical protein [Prosthecobacter sp.]
MKRRTTLLAIAASILTAAFAPVKAQAQLLLTSRISEITPAQASVGQTITVKISQPTLVLPPKLDTQKLQAIAGRFPGIATNQSLQIQFTGATANSFVDGENITRISSDTYTVRVPSGARSGRMRLKRGLASSLSQTSFVLTTVGFSIENQCQYNIVSIRVGGVERLSPGQIVAAVPATSPNVNILDIGTTAGSHNIEVTVGPNAANPVMVIFLPAQPAQRFISPSQGYANPIGILPLRAGNYLTSSPNTVSANTVSRTVSWQTFTVQANGTPQVNGFDFTLNTTTGVTTYVHWIGDRPNVLSTGTVVEPSLAQWGLNRSVMPITLRANNGSNYTTLQVTLPAASALATDGNTYVMQ